MAKRTATTKTITKAPKVPQAARLKRTDLNAASFVAPSASEITKNISDANLKEAAETLNRTNIKAQTGKGNQVKGVIGTRGSTNDPLESIINTGGYQGNGSTFSGSRMKARFRSSNKVGDSTKSGGSTGGLIDEILTPGFDEGRANGGHTSADPKDKPGTGLLGLSQNQKDAYGAMSVVFGGIAVIGGAIAGAAASPVIAGAATGVAIGGALVYIASGVLEKVGTPNPDAITGTSPGLTITGKGIGFDPITGKGPSRTEKLGQFTGDETTPSGVMLTQEEARNFQTAISQGQGNFLKNPNPFDESAGSTVIDDRSVQRVDLILAGGGAAGPISNSSQQFAGIQSAQFNVAVDALIV